MRERKPTASLEDEAHALLDAKAEATGLSMLELASKYVSIGVSYNLQDKGWRERIKKELEDLEAERDRQKPTRAIAKDRCDGLVKRETPGKKEDDPYKVDYICVKGSLTGPVKFKKLGGDPEKICVACKKTLNLEERWAQIRSKDKLGVEEHTYCTDGGWYDDKTGRINCKKQNRWQNQEVCFMIAHGKPCPSLKTLPARRVKRTGIRRR